MVTSFKSSVKSVVRLSWRGGEDLSVGRMLAFGALVWGAYSVAQILINGVVIDEVVTPAQIIAGDVQYPAGHPHRIYYKQAYNLFHFLAAGVWTIDPSPFAISAARNFLFLGASAFTPFAIAVLLTGRPLWGHFAAAITVSGIALRFEGIYPMWIFPGGASNGHIGLYSGMLIVALLLARFWRTGGLLLGLLPSIHPAMPLVIWPWSGVYLLISRKWRSRKETLRLLSFVGMGLAVCAALALIIFIRADNAVAVEPYNAQANGELIHRQFTLTTDVHRRLAPLWWFAYSVGPISLLMIGALLLWTPKRSEAPEVPEDTASARLSKRAVSWFLALSGIASLCVYGAWIFQNWIGALPPRIGMSMPYRFSNLTTLLLAPFTVAAMAYARSAMDKWARAWTMIMMAGLVYAVGAGFFSDRRPEGLYAMWGMLLAMDFYAYRNHSWRRWMGLAAILAIGGVTFAIGGPMRLGDNWIPLMKYLMGGFLICGLVLVLSGLKWRRRGNKREDKPGESHAISERARKHWSLRIGWGQVALLCACLLTSLAALPQSSYNPVFADLPRWDKISQYDRELIKWLGANARPNEMILAPIDQQSKLQPITNHPVLMEQESLYLMAYMPHLAPVIGAMMRDLYGFDYSDLDQLKRRAPRGRLSFFSPIWNEIWRKRKRDEWQALGQRYGFRLALAPKEAPLDLPVALPGSYWSLYEIPKVGQKSHQ